MTQVGLRHGVVSLLVPTLLCLIGFSTAYAQEDKAAAATQPAPQSDTKAETKSADRSDPKSSDTSTAKSDASDSSAARPSGSAKAQADQVDPLKRPLSLQEKKANEKRFKQEVSGAYKKWLDEDVRWIITDEERSAFKQLSNDEERDQFIEAFWQRRDPTPDTIENEFKEEHYRRIA